MPVSNNTILTFLGDVACPEGMTPRIVGLETLPFANTVINLEGALRDSGDPAPPPRALYNSAHLLQTLSEWNVRVASLANNHILDLGVPPSEVVRRLEAHGIRAVGAGDTRPSAEQAISWSGNGQEFVFLAYNWDVVRSRSAGTHRPGPNPLKPRAVLTAVERTCAKHPRAHLVVLMHWGYEFERYPIPAQRQLAIDIIGAGAAAVIGHHPHCVQGLEWHDGRPIAYSLGNWFLPQGDFFGRKIRYPEHCRLQLALEWDPAGETRCHWFMYEPETHQVRYSESEPARGSARLEDLTPFAGLAHDDYVRWFDAHRTRRKGLPAYRDYRHTLRNQARDWYCATRSWLVRRIVAWRNR